MMENVPGLAKDKRIDEVKTKLASLGHHIDSSSVMVKDAADFGVPQRRRRMILQASRLGALPEPSKADRHVSVFDAIGHLEIPGESGDELHDCPVKRSSRVNELIVRIPKDGGSRVDLPKEYWLPCHQRNPGAYNDVYGRMSWNAVSPTITGGCHNPSKGRFLHPEQNRAITLREAALLQTFPFDYKFSMSRGKESVALMIGNALPPELIRRHAEVIHHHLLENHKEC